MLMHHTAIACPNSRTTFTWSATTIAELDALGTYIARVDPTEEYSLVLNLLSKFALHLADVLEGRSGQDLNTKQTRHRFIQRLCRSQRVDVWWCLHFRIFLPKSLRRHFSLGAFDDLFDEEIRIHICNANGTCKAISFCAVEISFLIFSSTDVQFGTASDSVCRPVYEELQ
jgi:hypothetical protein